MNAAREEPSDEELDKQWASVKTTLDELLLYAESWEADARLLGNVRADDMAAALRFVLTGRTFERRAAASRERALAERVKVFEGLLKVVTGADAEVAERLAHMAPWQSHDWLASAITLALQRARAKKAEVADGEDKVTHAEARSAVDRCVENRAAEALLHDYISQQESLSAQPAPPETKEAPGGKTKVCKPCNGSGQIPANTMMPSTLMDSCHVCHGSGRVPLVEASTETEEVERKLRERDELVTWLKAHGRLTERALRRFVREATDAHDCVLGEHARLPLVALLERFAK